MEQKETIELYESSIENNQSRAKFDLDKTGLWKIDILVDNEQYTSFVIVGKLMSNLKLIVDEYLSEK